MAMTFGSIPDDVLANNVALLCDDAPLARGQQLYVDDTGAPLHLGTELASAYCHRHCHVRRRDNLTAAIHMTVEELLAWSDRSRRGTLDVDAEEAKAKAAMLAQHKEYQWTKRELGRLLGLGPEDINPLERSELGGPDDPRTRRALWLSFRLDKAYLDQLLWWRQPPRLRVGAS